MTGNDRQRMQTLADQRPDGLRADQSPSNAGEQPGSAWPGVSPNQPFQPPVITDSGSVPVNAMPGHPESSAAGQVDVRVQRLDLPGSGPVVSRPPFHTAPTNAAEGDGRD